MPLLTLSTSIPHAAQIFAQRIIWSVSMLVRKKTGWAVLPAAPAVPAELFNIPAAMLATALPCHLYEPLPGPPTGSLSLIKLTWMTPDPKSETGSPTLT